MKRILGLTSIRSDYDLMSGVYRALHDDPDIDLRLLVSGAHLSSQFGRTVDLIVADGFELLGDVESLISGDSKSSRLKTAANLLNGSIDLIRAYAPDLMIFAGDREDVLVAATIGAFLDIPTVHFFGGDHAADGHVDNPVRHATSKLSTAHFVSIDEHRQRLLRLGESDRRIAVIGSVALDKFASEPLLGKDAVLQGMSAKPHAAQHPLAVLIFHPVDQERATAPTFVRDAVNAMVDAAVAKWGAVDILINNAGVLRDKSFAKMSLDDFQFVVDVHLMGAVNCTKAVWDGMRERNYGRIVMTTSSSGLYGNFGQANYGAAKMALVGLMQTLAIEGAKTNIRVNCVAPTAHTRMTEDLGAALPLEALGPELVSPGVLYLVSEDAPTRVILGAGAGGFERAYVTLTQGDFAVGPDALEQIAARFDIVSDRSGEIVPEMGAAQGMIELSKAQKAHA